MTRRFPLQASWLAVSVLIVLSLTPAAASESVWQSPGSEAVSTSP